jgi:Niemann-Pick C1 protein
MWLFAGVSLAICTPCFRTALEALFAELTIIFFNHLVLVALGTVLAFVGALALHYTHALVPTYQPPSECDCVNQEKTETNNENFVINDNGNAMAAVIISAETLRWSCQRLFNPQSSANSFRGASKRVKRVVVVSNGLLTTLFFASALLPTALFAPATASIMTTATTPSLSLPSVSRRLSNNSVPYTLTENQTALAIIQSKLTTCKYSKGKECVNNVTSVPEFGIYKQGPGQCVTLDTSYVNTTFSSAALPNRYLPISVEDGNAQGFQNRFSKWSSANREQFPVDCPLLYNNTIATGQDLLCCTENQYESLKTQVRMIQPQCTACQENLRNVWCQFACNPNNSMFIEVEQVRLMPGDDEHEGAIFPAVEEATYYVGSDTIRDIYDYCEKDSFFKLLCSPTQNCTDGFGLLEFMGSYKFNSLGSPLQINVKTMQKLSKQEQEEKICPCGETNATGCVAPLNAQLKSCVGVCGSICAVGADDKRKFHEACYGAVSLDDESDGASVSGSSTVTADSKWDPLMAYMAANLEETSFTSLNIFLIALGILVGCGLIAGFVIASRSDGDDLSAPFGGVGGVTGAHVPAGAGAGVYASEQYLGFMDQYMASQMKRWGVFISGGRRPYYTIAIMLTFAIVCGIGLTKIEVETNPVKLWVAESSRPYKERDRYGELFMPFYRSQQVMFVPKDGGSIGRAAYLKEAIRLQQIVADVTSGPADAAFPERVTLDDICWKTTGTACAVNSITQYFQNRMDHFEFYEKYDLALFHFSNCIYSPQNADIQGCDALRAKGASIPASMSDCPCLSAFGAPMNLYNTYLGGFPAGAETNTTQYMESTAIVSTALVYNYYDDEKNEPAVAWEREYIETLKLESTQNEIFEIFFMAETSVQDEIKVESTGDMFPVILSYTLMIVYVSLGINRWSMSKRFFQTSKITVGFLGVICIMISVSSTIGLFMWAGVKLQLVIMEVVPFLTLAIGVDNIFLIVHAISHMQDELVHEEAILFVGLDGKPEAVQEIATVLVSEGLGYIGPSIFMASIAESVAFAFGCISPMPAVLWFAAFSAAAVLINFCIQMTLLVAIITLDKRRELAGKYDIFCWRKAAIPEWLKDDEELAEEYNSDDLVDEGDDRDNVGSGETRGVRLARQLSNQSRRESIEAAALKPSHFFDQCVDAYASFLSKKIVKLVVLLVFSIWSLLSIYSIENLRHGLPQAESMPSESYLISYFNAIDKYLATGAPVFFVVEGGYKRNPAVFDLNNQSVEALFCKSKDFCDEFSIPKIVDVLANDADRTITHLSNGVTYSWMDDFWGFVSPDSECCRVDSTTKAYLPIMSDNATYSAARSKNPTCLSATSTVPPVPKESYMSLFSMFATASAGSLCSSGGGSIYRGQFSLDNKPVPVVTTATPQVVLNSTGYGNEITAFSYMLVSTANPTQQHFIDGYKQARRAAEWISEKTGVDVWAYSITYVYFDQYLTIVNDTYNFVGLSLAAIFVIHAIYFGSLLYPLLIALCAANIVVQVMGMMEPNDILLNGLSVVNLIIAAGISVEFCGHYIRMFAKSRCTSGNDRAKDALRKVLVSVLFGITITKIVGLSALTLADSRIFQKYYFRMYMTVVLCGVLNGMVFLPVLLSVFVDVRQFIHRRRGRGGSVFRDTNQLFSESPVFYPVVPTAKNASTGGTNV